MKVVVGSGYISLVSGACFADFGDIVTCIDNNPEKLERFKQYESPIYEPGLDALNAADVDVVLAEWDEFRALDLDRVKMLLKAPIFVDMRNVYGTQSVRDRGFAYSSIGRA